MEFVLTRDVMGNGYTLGKLAVDGAFFSYTCEDQDRQLEDFPDAKIPGETAIPRGRYRVETYFSPHFQKLLPHLLDVPGYTYVLMHGGNGPADTEGCVLHGRVRDTAGPNYISNCAERVAALASLVQKCEEEGEEVWISVS